ncbi:MAG: Na(+)-translocating NADH-quinone reductase subunit C [Lysobacter sp.]|nr:Na(+)-translocating NADH-quinone reductase subunit C [Lysobacter sp.]
MSRLDSPRYTFIFATVMCVVCAALVSVAAVSLAPRQKANARLYMEKNVLVAAGLVAPGQNVGLGDVERVFQSDIKVRLVDFATGKLVPEGERNARDYDQRAARSDPAASREAPANDAGIKRVANRGVVYFVMKDGKVDQMVISVEGLGMWGTIYGFLALDKDAVTVRGITYYDHRETPGLGGEIGNPAWQAMWKGRRGYDDRGNARITVIKGQAGPPETDPLSVDGLSGATITSNAVTRLMRFWLSEDGYGRFLNRFRERKEVL